MLRTNFTSPGNTVVWSTLDSHKIFPQATDTAAKSYSMGLAAAIPAIPAGFNHSVVFTVAPGGATAGVYAWGEAIQGYHETTRLPSVTLTDIGYYTDDGAYYYVWGGGGKFPPHDPELSPCAATPTLFFRFPRLSVGAMPAPRTARCVPARPPVDESCWSRAQRWL